MTSKIFFWLLLTCMFLNANEKHDSIFWIREAGKYFKIEPKILINIAKEESDLNKYTILIKTDEPHQIQVFLKKYGIKTKSYDKRHISIYPRNVKEAYAVYMALVKGNRFKVIDYDLGIMQINRKNFSRYKVSELKYYLDYRRNIFLGADILRKCFVRFKRTRDTIECYNKGTSYAKIKQSNYDYFNRFYRLYASASR